jgi:hypothetical protein
VLSLNFKFLAMSLFARPCITNNPTRASEGRAPSLLASSDAAVLSFALVNKSVIFTPKLVGPVLIVQTNHSTAQDAQLGVSQMKQRLFGSPSAIAMLNKIEITKFGKSLVKVMQLRKLLGHYE